MNERTVATAYYEVRDRTGKAVRTGDNVKQLKACLGRGHTVWHVAPVMRTLALASGEAVSEQIQKKDKVSTVKGTFRSSRVGGEYTTTLTHTTRERADPTLPRSGEASPHPPRFDVARHCAIL
jgi:hypothetical protein